MTVTGRAVQRVYQSLLKRVGEANPRPRIEPVKRLAELAGSPQLSYPIIQFAGTNGKTSTSRAAESLLRAHGLRTGLFTSPHLVNFTERFQVDGAPVDGAVLVDAWEELQLPLQVVDAELAESGAGPITFFEALAVLAFTVFADVPVDVALIEVGMGGEWDATNLADADIAVFTPIGLDHTEILGSDIATIARTKAGIIKAGATVVSARQEPEALTEIIEVAETQDARVLLADRDFELLEDRLAVGGRQIRVMGLHRHSYDPSFVPLFGHHQAENVVLAIAAVEAFLGGERPIPEEIVEVGLRTLTSPGRLQLLGTEPVVYVDAAHNPHGAEALARAVAESFSFTELACVVGALEDKDSAGVLRAITPIADLIYLTPFDSPRSLDRSGLETLATTEIQDGADAKPLAIEVSDSLGEALEVARAWAAHGPNRAVLVLGSVLLAGEAIQHARDEGWAHVPASNSTGDDE